MMKVKVIVTMNGLFQSLLFLQISHNNNINNNNNNNDDDDN